jgi:site-specific DNA-methyltransferase (adenine-specific)
MSNKDHNPDVLTCLANLSSDEVFTPPALVNEMLDILPASIWRDKNAKFLDPFCKSGVFLREITKRLVEGLKQEIPDEQKRVNHILKNQIFGIAITELTALLSRRSLYCAKTANGKYSIAQVFSGPEGNVVFEKTAHSWVSGRCEYCGASKEAYERAEGLEAHAYKFIHIKNPNDIFKMKFDVIIGNPPYQLSDGGAGASAMPLYHKFVHQAKRLNPRYISMIIPSRWFAGGRGLDEFREEMKNDKRISKLVDHPKSRECFPGVDIAGGVCYFLWDREYSGLCSFVSKVKGQETEILRALDEFDVVIRDNKALGIIKKVRSCIAESMQGVVLKVSPFGLRSYERGEPKRFKGAVKLVSSGGVGYIKTDLVQKNQELIETFKVCIGYLNPDRAGVNNASDGMMNVTTKVRVLCPGEVVTETYIIPFCSINENETRNCADYIRTKFARFMISLTLSSMHIAQGNFALVPLLDFGRKWSDAQLFKLFKLSEEEISYIESAIRKMEDPVDEK